MMRMKFFYAFLGVLMISGLFAPLIMVNNSIGYEEIKPVEVMQISDTLDTWHHDCSNTSLFDQYLDWPMNWWWETYTVSGGTMFSDGASLSFSDITYASPDWYGPIFVHNITEPFPLDNFEEFTVELDIDNTDTIDAGIMSVYLCDANYMPVIRVFCSDSWDWRSYGHNRAEYRFSNGSYVYHGNTDYITWTLLNDSISIWSEPNGDLYAEVPGFGSSLLLKSEFIQHDREIHHIVIQTGRLAGYTYMPSMIDDIYLQWIPEDSEPGIANDSISVDSPDDIVYTVGATGNEITWTPLSTIPDSFELFVDGELVDSGSWDGSVISINVDGLAPWIYNYSIYVNNTEGESVTDWVLVTVTGAGSTGGFDYLIISISIGSMLVIVVIIGAICRNRGPGSTSVPSSGYEW